MSCGSLSIEHDPIPICAPPYTTGINTFDDVDLLSITYRTKLDHIRHLVPECLELEDEPLVTATLVSYGMSTVGSYNEYVHQVEVTYQGTKYDYCISLLLDNESAIFSGREQFGYPKTFGKVAFEKNTGSALIVGQVEKPAGFSVVKFAFTPTQKILQASENDSVKATLNLRVIPSPIPGRPASVRELVPLHMEMTGGTCWVGKGSVSFPDTLEHHPIHHARVVRYESAVFIRGASMTLIPPTDTFPI